MAKKTEKVKEIWKELENIPNYAVSNLGRIRNLTTGKFLKPSLHREKGCYIFGVRHNNQNHVFTLHRIIAELFSPNPENCRFVVHKNGDKLNNSIDNLQWVNYIDRGRQNSSISLEEEKIIMKKLRQGITGAELALEYNTSEMSISRINKKFMRKLAGELKNSGSRFLSTDKKEVVTELNDIDWIGFIQESFINEKVLLTTSNIIDCLIQRYGFVELDRLRVSNQINILLNKLITLGIVKRIGVPKKQRFFYGLTDWYSAKSILLPEFQGAFDESIEKKLERASSGRFYNLKIFIYNVFKEEQKVLTINEILFATEKYPELKSKSKEVLKKELQLALEDLFHNTILNRMEADENDYWYGLSDWWFKKNNRLKNIYTGL